MKPLALGSLRRIIRLNVALSPYTLQSGDLEKLEKAVRGAKDLRTAVLTELGAMYPEIAEEDAKIQPASKEEADEWFEATMKRIRSRG